MVFMKKNLISLFAGAGGLDLGLEMAGFTTRVANELTHHACETLRINKEISSSSPDELINITKKISSQRCYKGLKSIDEIHKKILSGAGNPFLKNAEIIEGDIRCISSESLLSSLEGEPVFCIAGGPPCQPFSKAGKQKSLDCTKNGDLFYEFVRIVGDLKPKWFLFENVKGLTFTKTDVLYYVCSKCEAEHIAPFKVRQEYKNGEASTVPCDSCGNQHSTWKVVNEPGGSLKIIKNEFEKIGYTIDSNILNAADFGVPQIRERLFIVGSLDGKKITWPTPSHSKEAQKNGLKPWVSMYDALWSNGHSVYGNFDRNNAKLWVKNVVRPHDEPVTWSLDRPAPTIGAHQGAKLAIAPFDVPEEQIFRQQWHTLGRRQGDTPPVFVEHQYLSDQELLKLQTFPEYWYLHGTRMERVFQIGNAVPPILGEIVGEAILLADI